MSNKFLPALAVMALCFASSCGYDKTGTTTEVINANADEDVNPVHIRGYGDREADMKNPGAPSPDQYYAFSTASLSAEQRRELDGKVAVEMVKAYYDPEMQLSDLAVKYSRQSNTKPAAPQPAAATDTAASSSATTPNE
ncbi:hypothetical protein [Pontibacter oryzae]|uniref:Uncharacterized protein n=1 Tax=Pontibacter oryzae TaxID=2304593 RepID=A0A399SJT2_9BACT|nr:hypothetical protein [Pontibacter oryzae]RIJ43051.1 hypothetical protein D1627_04240 [Pontibacter oryzae]